MAASSLRAPQYVFDVELSAPSGAPDDVYGYVIDSEGSIFRYDATGITGVNSSVAPDRLGRPLLLAELEAKVAQRRFKVGQLPAQSVRAQIAVLQPASWGGLASSPPFAVGARRLLGYLQDPATGSLIVVRLRDESAGTRHDNTAAAARQLADWLDSHLDIDAWERAEALVGRVPIDSLSTGCVGHGIIASGWRVRLDRAGSLEWSRYGLGGDPAPHERSVAPEVVSAIFARAEAIGWLAPRPASQAGGTFCSLSVARGVMISRIAWGDPLSTPTDLAELVKAVADLAK
jgi:hypothetical protein